MIVTWLLLLLLVGLSLRIHHGALEVCSVWLVPRLHPRSRPRVEYLVMVLMAAHLAQLFVFGLGYYAAAELLEIGSLQGTHDGSLRSYVYFSGVTYTSLGLGDMYPVGELRLMAGVEALTGLLSIGWSASFLFVEMQRLWNDELADPPIPFHRPRSRSTE